MRKLPRWTAAALFTLSFATLSLAATPRVAEPGPTPSLGNFGGSSSDTTVYEDRTENTSATITQLQPGNSTNPTQNMNLTKVRRVRIVQGTLVIEWGSTATTIIPQQFVLSMTLNRRSAVAEPATQPAP